MGRTHRAAQGGYVYHVLNRANARMRIFDDDPDYIAFEKVLAEAVERTETRLLAYCLMPNHWHLLVWPRKDGELSRFVGWLTLTHTQRWHAHRHSSGSGHVYQGRFKSFPVQEDEHFYTVARYVERNGLRANLGAEPNSGSGPAFFVGSATPRKTANSWRRGRSPARPTGSITSTGPRQKRNCRPFAAVSSAAAPSEMNLGAIESCADLASKPRSALAVDLRNGS